ncbi:MAG: carbon-nitrogen hydrolase family protein [Desulfobacterales bacterium]|nr:MAG: carbon-nitrogen hydrolase family protein [Desulfobacterales bacterium]
MAIKVAITQMNSILGDVEANLKKVEALMRSAANLNAQIVLVPETFTTGYDVADRLPQVSDTIPGKVTDFLGKLTQELNLYFYGSFVERNGDQYHNTGAFIGPSGEVLARYRKVHLFSAEKEMFVAGDEPAIVKTELGTFALTICMDLLFPEYIRGLVLNGADYILNSTDWLRYGPLDEWEWHYKQIRALACIRALENTVCLAMACQWGKEGEFTKFGHSCIISPSGRVLAGIEEGEGVVVQDLTIEGVNEWRQIASYLEDRKDHLDLYRKQLDI